jgi:hypothetical protein
LVELELGTRKIGGRSDREADRQWEVGKERKEFRVALNEAKGVSYLDITDLVLHRHGWRTKLED